MIINQAFAEELALDLLKINAVVLRPDKPFVWSSGWNSPIYCDNRLTLKYPEIRNKIAQNFAAFIDEKHNDIDVITGTATAGIPHAAWVAQQLSKPMAYVRSKAKSYGMTNQIEGGVAKGESTLIIEDLISTGGSVLSVVDVLRFVGADVKCVCSIFTYGFDLAQQKLAEYELPYFTLTDYNTLIRVASENGYIREEDKAVLEEWRKSPDTWPK